MGRMDNKTVFITGAARGQGRSHAVLMAEEGADVVITDICAPIPEVAPYETATSEDLEQTKKLVEEAGARCLAIEADARDSRAMNEAVALAIDTFGKIDGVAINHGVCINVTWDKHTDEIFDTVIEANLSAAWRAVRPVLPHMIERGSGSIVFTSSTAGQRAYPSLSAYTASKHGVLGLMKSLATELGQHQVRVNAILPGNVGTPMLHNQTVMDMFNGGPGGSVEKMVFPAQATHLLPIPWVDPIDISRALLYLLSDDSRYVTGVEMRVDAGTLTQPAGIPAMAASRLGELEYAVGQADQS